MPERVEIVSASLDPAEILGRLGSTADGAVALFVGQVRDHHEGRRVLRLEYHAYPEMALHVMRRICREVRQACGASDMAMVHRVGVLHLGEASVVVAAAAPHRAEAFDACRQAMERLKREVPIWKKEHFDGGSAWVDGCRPVPPREG